MQREEYAQYYVNKETAWWKRVFDVQRPYRWHVKSLNLGFVIDAGCGLGRNLAHLGGHGVGVDINEHMIETARTRGLTAFTPKGFENSEFNRPDCFDSLLCAHVLEHVSADVGFEFLSNYLKNVKPGGKVVLITPQEKGYACDPTHVRFVGYAELEEMGRRLGLKSLSTYSFPFPRFVGKVFPHNEFIYIGEKPKNSAAK